jgi:CO/xanthine dehydrogenase FAD-binding subunit
MKLNVETPARLLDINRLPLDRIEATPDGGLKIDAGRTGPIQVRLQLLEENSP